jgi:excisionase family DNA binding protein
VPERDDFMTVAEVASVLKLNQQTVRNWIDQGKLPALHIGRRVRICRTDFDSLIEASVIGDRQPALPSIWEREVPLPQVPGGTTPNRLEPGSGPETPKPLAAQGVSLIGAPGFEPEAHALAAIYAAHAIGFVHAMDDTHPSTHLTTAGVRRLLQVADRAVVERLLHRRRVDSKENSRASVSDGRLSHLVDAGAPAV